MKIQNCRMSLIWRKFKQIDQVPDFSLGLGLAGQVLVSITENDKFSSCVSTAVRAVSSDVHEEDFSGWFEQYTNPVALLTVPATSPLGLTFVWFSVTFVTNNDRQSKSSKTLSADLASFTPILLLSSISFFVRYPPSCLNGTQPKPAEVSAIWNVCPKSGVYLLRIGAPIPPFSTISQLGGKLNGLYLRNEAFYT